MTEYQQLVAYLGIGFALGLGALIVPWLISPRYKGPETEQTYECGVDTVGTAWIRFGVSFYLFALIFVAFEVDVLYLFPVALVYNEPEFGWRALVEVSIFLVILSLAIVYAWRKGVIRWSR
ncbi:MAG: NADH-quinone oxidoreductase subunit A [Planctomycetota bacterium]|jgi:NADH-quinone oxidoreductase subunit A